MVGHISLSDAGVWSEEIIVLNKCGTKGGPSPFPRVRTRRARARRARGEQDHRCLPRGGVVMISRSMHEHCGRDRGRGRCRRKGMQAAVSGYVSQVMKFGSRRGCRRVATARAARRAFGRCVRCACTGLFSVVEHACVARHGEAPAAVLAASRRP